MGDLELNFFSTLDKVLRPVVFTTCILSAIGSFMIILTYCIFPDIRTKVRLILLHLSVMDMGIALSNLIGAAINFEKYQTKTTNANEWSELNGTINELCKAQGFIAMYTTYGSVFWTNCLAVYLYFAVIHHSPKKNNIMFWISCVISYVSPLILCIWLLVTDRLGSTPYGSGGWCALVNKYPGSDQRNLFPISFGYDFFIYVTFILVPVLYIGTRIHIRLEIQKTKDYVHPSLWLSTVNGIDYKFLLIPVAFIFLRIWTCIINIFTGYTNIQYHLMYHMKQHHAGHIIISILMCLSAIGDSGQGAANGLLFILFSKKVREKLFGCFRGRGKDYGSQLNNESDPLVNSRKIRAKKGIIPYYKSTTHYDATPTSSLPTNTPPRTPSPEISEPY